MAQSRTTKPKSDEVQAVESNGFIVKRNFGFFEGTAHKFIPAGTRLVTGEDDALIAKLQRLGAVMVEE